MNLNVPMRWSRLPHSLLESEHHRGDSEAIQSFCSALPRETGLAFVIVQHLDGTAHNRVPEILSRLCKIPAEEAADGTKLAADHIYVAPGHSIVRLREGILEVTKATTPEERRGVIDAFFHSLAEERQAGAIGVILSGSGTDGALGLKAISDNGGMTIVQESSTARYDSMPRNGATIGVADRILPPEKMASEIIAYATHVHTLLAGDNGEAVCEQIGGAWKRSARSSSGKPSTTSSITRPPRSFAGSAGECKS